MYNLFINILINLEIFLFLCIFFRGKFCILIINVSMYILYILCKNYIYLKFCDYINVIYSDIYRNIFKFMGNKSYVKV